MRTTVCAGFLLVICYMNAVAGQITIPEPCGTMRLPGHVVVTTESTLWITIIGDLSKANLDGWLNDRIEVHSVKTFSVIINYSDDS